MQSTLSSKWLTFLPVDLVDRMTADRTVQHQPFAAHHRPVWHRPNDRRSIHVQTTLMINLTDLVER